MLNLLKQLDSKRADNRRFLLKAVASTPLLTPLFTPLVAGAAGEIAFGKPIAIVVSYPVGGGADLMARLIAPKLAEVLGQPVVVENKPGASGTIAAGFVARAQPDGTTLLLDASSFAVNPSLIAKLPYDSVTSFTPLAVLALYPNVLVCHPGFEAKSVADVIRLSKAKPNSVAYASSGNGSAQHLAGALFESLAKIELNHVPYRGGGPALNDVMAGQVPLFFANVASSLPLIKAGKLRPLAVTAKLRTRALPDIPTMTEAGVNEHVVLEWNPVLAPSGISPEVKVKLRGALLKVMQDPEVLGRVRALGGDLFNFGPEGSTDAFLKDQANVWSKLIRARGITSG